MKKNNKLYLLLGLIAIIIVTIIILSGPSQNNTQVIENKDTGTRIGDLAPDFKLKTPQNTEIQLSSFKNKKPVILSFWATWCLPCEEELPFFQKEYEKNRIEILAINLQEDPNKAQEWFNKRGFTMPILLDPNAAVKNLYGIFTQPVTYFIDKNGVIQDKKFGQILESEFNEKIKKIVNTEKSNLPTEGEKTEFGDIVQITNGIKHIAPLNKLISGGPGKDGIPSIDNPKFESAKSADSWLNDEDIIFGININEIKRAYPQRILNWHEIVNDMIGNRPILITFCPLCGSAVAFERTINNRPVEFGVSGKLFNSDLVMYDRLTDTYWNQISGKAIVGELVGLKLSKVPIDTLKWKDWKELHPDTQVLSKNTGFIRDYSRYPYGDYESSSRIIFPVENEDNRLQEKEIVYGIEISGKTKAYPLRNLKEGTTTDNFNGIIIEINNNKGVISFKNKDTNEGIVPVRNFWFAWVAHYPNTGLYTEQ
ncbi:MAG: DUF3179 domain-containing (seleno)protein [Nanoarchaeota archaeon]